MKANKFLCLAAALVIAAGAFAGCADSSSGSSSKADSSSSQSSSNSSSEANKPNSIGYDINSGKRLYDELKEKYGKNGYNLIMKSTTNISSEIYLNVKDGKISNTDKNPYSNTTMVFIGGDKATIYDHTSKTYKEQKVDNAKTFVEQSDLLFGLAGDFVKAAVDEKNDVINEYYNIKDASGKSVGTICFCFRGHDGSFAQITVQYEGSEFPILFGITEIKECDEKAFNAKETYKEYKKV